MMSEGINMSELYPEVVKSIICQDTQVQQLVYLYLMHYAEFKPQEALLSVNTLQMHLKSSDAAIRAQALRVLTSIRLPLIVQLQILAVENTIRDSSNYVRKLAMHALAKIHLLAPHKLKILIPFLEIGLADKDLFVRSSAVATFLEIVPARWDLIHPHFNLYCSRLLEMDDWGKATMLRLLTPYVRLNFANPHEESTNASSDSAFDMFLPPSGAKKGVSRPQDTLELLWKIIPRLLRSMCAAVVEGAASFLYYCGNSLQQQQAVIPMIRLVRDDRTSLMALKTISVLSKRYPSIWGRQVSAFYLLSTDLVESSLLKLEILSTILTESTKDSVLREFEFVLTNSGKFSPQIVAGCIQSAGRCMQASVEVSNRMMPVVLRLLFQKNEDIVSECVIQIKNLVQRDASRAPFVMKHVLKMDWMHLPSDARSCIVWMMGEYSDSLNGQGPDLLRQLLRGFSQEPHEIRKQILNFSLKLQLRVGSQVPEVPLMFQYACKLGNFDTSFDLRDRARLLHALFLSGSCPTLSAESALLFLREKPLPEVVNVQGEFGHRKGVRSG